MVKGSLVALFPILAVLLAATVYLDQPGQESLGARVQPVNAVLGDRSFVERFGRMPDRTTDEDLRIRTHLQYVEHLLRARTVEGLTPAQRTARALNLDRLHAYWTRGLFPPNDSGSDQRLPTFIDGEGRICAVGYLVERSAGRAVAEAINRQYKYSVIADMRSPVLDAWAAQSGLTKEELAMIQPQYGCEMRHDCEEPPPEGEATSDITSPAEAVVMLLNTGAVIVNGIQIDRNAPTYLAPSFGLLTAATGVALSTRHDAEYRTGDLLLGGMSVLFSAVNLTRWFQQRRGGSANALVPEAHAAVVPGKSAFSGTSLHLLWTF